MKILKCKECDKIDDLVCSALNGFCSDCFISNINKKHDEFKETINSIKNNRG